MLIWCKTSAFDICVFPLFWIVTVLLKLYTFFFLWKAICKELWTCPFGSIKRIIWMKTLRTQLITKFLFSTEHVKYWASLIAQLVKNLLAMQESWVWSLGWEDLLEEGVATHSSILAWRIPMRSLSELQYMESQRVRHDWATKHKNNYNIKKKKGLKN